MSQFALELHPDKTRLIEFGRFAMADRRGARGTSTGDLRFPRFHALLQEEEERKLRAGAQADSETGHANLETGQGRNSASGCTRTSTTRRNGWGEWSTDG